MRSNIRSWSLVAGILIILAACIFAYLSTRPAEADVAGSNQVPISMAARNI